jgi:predicted  nucleic acid-binding Zn-ribbon protein
MPYRCVHCSAAYEDEATEVINGCSKCKSKFFFYIKPEKLKEILENKPEEDELTSSEKKQIEKDVRDIVGIKDAEEPVFLDFESIKIIKPGKYLLDIGKLLAADKPKVYKLEDGKYIIDLSAIRVDTTNLKTK